MLFKYSRHLLAVLAVVKPLCLHAAPPLSPALAIESKRMDALRSLRLDSIPGAMPTFYSPRAEVRAKYLQALLGGEIQFFAEQFHVALRPVTMAVLNAKQWPVVAGDEPYGMPSIDGTEPPVFVMPASWDGVKWMAVPRRNQVPPAMLRAVMANGKKWEQVKYEGCDGIGTHEIGHSIISQLGIDPQTRWFSELLASYVGYAYLKATDPVQALSNEIFWIAGISTAPHRFTQLDDFESKYDELQERYPGNYAWYQLALDQRVIETYQEHGLDFLRQVQARFPKGGPTLNGVQVLERLELMSPGWQAWSARLEAGNINTVSAEALHRP